jgi:sodium-dependent dicarboxylate transporter 2/3/5
MRIDSVGVILGPIVFLVLMLTLTSIDFNARVAVALIAWMVCYWLTNAIPIYATALLPLIVLPATGAMPLGSVAVNYADRVIFLLMGSLMIAKAIEVSNLHRRFALRILMIVGSESKSILFGFIIVTAVLSAFMSNTVVAAMMLPLAVSMLSVINESQRKAFAPVLMLAIAYSASIGGVITIVGTPPNLIFSSLAREMGYNITFLSWLPIGLPVGSTLLIILWLYLSYGIKGIKVIEGKHIVRDELIRLGPMSKQEKYALSIFMITVVAWMSRSLWGSYIPSIDDYTIALASAFMLFVIRVDGRRLLTWDEAAKIPWGVLILIGGSLAIAGTFTATGLDKSIASIISVELGSDISMLALVTSITVFMTELMSNTAIATLMIPIVKSVALNIGMEPLSLMIAATLSTTLSFMLPVATPPNAMVFATGHLTVAYMARVGLIMNIFSIIVITFFSYLLTRFVNV